MKRPIDALRTARSKKKTKNKVVDFLTWLDTPTRVCSHAHSWPFPMKELPKHRALMLLVNNSAGSGTPPRVVHAKMGGA